MESHCRQSHIEQRSEWGLGEAEDEQEIRAGLKKLKTQNVKVHHS